MCKRKRVKNMDLYDIHSHILPGVDDGAKSMEESLEMLRIAKENAICTIIVTPHNKPGRHNVHTPSMNAYIKQLQEQMNRIGLSIELIGGNELYYRMELAQELQGGVARTMADSRYVLVEFGPMDDYDYLRNGVYDLLSEGYFPIIAHVERYQCLLERIDRISDLSGMGAYIQVNAGSVMGAAGFKIKDCTRKLLKQGLVQFVATDAHDTKKRAPELKKCADFIARKYGEEYAVDIFRNNPKHIIRNEIL